MTYYDVAFESAQYRAIRDRAAKYYQDRLDGSAIPLVTTSLDASEYRYTNLLDPHASWAGVDWSENFERGKVVSNYSDFNLYTQQMNLFFDLNQRNAYGESLIADKRGALVDKWAIDVNMAEFHGPVIPFGMAVRASNARGGTQLAEGFIGQLTSIENIDGTDSVLSVKGDIWKGMNTMIDGMTFAIRKEGPPILMITDEYVAKEAFDPDRIYQDKVEGDFIREYLMGPKATQGRKIGAWLVTNSILAEAVDDTDGVSADTVDVTGTDSRIFMCVPDSRWIGRVVSRGFSMVGEDTRALGTNQIWGWKGRGCVFNTEAAEYTEAINWA